MKLTAVVTTCNRPHFLNEALTSIFNQSRRPDEVIVVDDNSECDNDTVLAKFAVEDIKYIRLKQKSGANLCRNVGVNAALGDIVAFLDDDDIWKDNFVEEHMRAYLQDEGEHKPIAVVCGFQIMGISKYKINPAPQITQVALRKGNIFCGMSGFSAHKTILLQEVFDESLSSGQDWDLYLRIVCAGYSLKNISKPLFEYRQNNPDGISMFASTIKIQDVSSRLASINKHREFLGERSYKYRVARHLLAYIGKKPDKLKWLLLSCQKAGYWVSFVVLLEKILNHIKNDK